MKIKKIFLFFNIILAVPATALAHGTSDGGGANRVLDAFTHWPPSTADAHYYLEAIFLLAFIVLAVIQIVQKYRAKKNGTTN